jgi:hypothetical protein
MSTRERWVIYPLLFLAIGFAMRSGVIQSEQEKQITTDLVRCKAIEVEDDQPRVIIKAKGKGDTGALLALLHADSEEALVLENDGRPQIFEGIYQPSGQVKRRRLVWFIDPLNPYGELSPSKRPSPKEKSKQPTKSEASKTEKSPD